MNIKNHIEAQGMDVKLFRYDKDKGGIPVIADRVEICHTGSDMDGLSGHIGGFFGEMHLIALVVLDCPYTMPNELEAFEVVGMSVPCLRQI